MNAVSRPSSLLHDQRKDVRRPLALRAERGVCSPLEWLEGEMKREKHDADEDGRKDAPLLKLFGDQKHPPRQRQLAAHLERLQ